MKRQGWLAGTVPIWVLLGFAAIVAVLTILLVSANGRAYKNGLAADSLEAARDTTRLVAEFRDSVGMVRLIYQQRLEQRDIVISALEKHLKERPVVTSTITVKVPGETVHDTVTVGDAGDDVRTGTFEQYQAPYRIRSAVVLPPVGRQGSIETAVQLDSLILRPRVECGAKMHGVAPALLSVEGPAWATIGLRELAADPGVCNPRSQFQVGVKVPWWIAVSSALAGLIAGMAID